MSSQPILDGLRFNPYYIQAKANITPNASGVVVNAIPFNRNLIVVSGVTTDANDFIQLPLVADVPNGHKITIVCQAGSDFEMRTPATSDTKINNVDSDGTNEYFCRDNQTITIIKVDNTICWIAWALDSLGAQVTAVVPDAVSASASESLSPSASASASRSPSASLSPSASSSASLSPSASASASQSPSASLSPS